MSAWKDESIQALQEVGFTGFMLDDHVPHVVDDTEWGHRGRAFATGYIMALVEAVRKARAPIADTDSTASSARH
jgi:mannonate dehydratase